MIIVEKYDEVDDELDDKHINDVYEDDDNLIICNDNDDETESHVGIHEIHDDDEDDEQCKDDALESNDLEVNDEIEFKLIYHEHYAIMREDDDEAYDIDDEEEEADVDDDELDEIIDDELLIIDDEEEDDIMADEGDTNE